MSLCLSLCFSLSLCLCLALSRSFYLALFLFFSLRVCASVSCLALNNGLDLCTGLRRLCVRRSADRLARGRTLRRPSTASPGNSPTPAPAPCHPPLPPPAAAAPAAAMPDDAGSRRSPAPREQRPAVRGRCLVGPRLPAAQDPCDRALERRAVRVGGGRPAIGARRLGGAVGRDAAHRLRGGAGGAAGLGDGRARGQRLHLPGKLD